MFPMYMFNDYILITYMPVAAVLWKPGFEVIVSLGKSCKNQSWNHLLADSWMDLCVCGVLISFYVSKDKTKLT